MFLTVLIALAPAAIVSIIQGVDRLDQDVEGVRQRLVQTAAATADDEQDLLSSAEQVLRALSNQPQVRTGSDACHTSLANALRGLSFFVNIARIDAGGNLMCSALPYDGSLNISDRPYWNQTRRATGFFVASPAFGEVSQRLVMSGLLPLRNEKGQFDGALAIALDVRWLDFVLRAKQLPEGAVAVLFDSSGSLVAANNQDVAVRLFTKRITAGSAGQVLRVAGPGGEKWSFAVAPLPGNNAFVGFAMRDADLYAGTYLRVAAAFLLPLLMGLAAAAIWIATDRQVTRWLVYLRRIAAAYTRGHYAIRPDLSEAPLEFQALGDTFSSMAAAVQERDRSLREAVAQKTMLIRETHHRVKNNLQIVMSLLSLQAGQLRDPAAQDALRQAQVRVNALALVHRILHELEDLDSVDIKRLLTDLAHQIQEGFGAERRDLRLELDIAARRISGDLAVPIALFTVEVLTNAFKHAFAPGTHGGAIHISLSPVADDKMKLTVEDNGVGLGGNLLHGGTGSRLIVAFTQQVGGTLEVLAREDGGTIVSLTFPDPLIREALRDADKTSSEYNHRS